jgi:hypothetical protein
MTWHCQTPGYSQLGPGELRSVELDGKEKKTKARPLQPVLAKKKQQKQRARS